MKQLRCSSLWLKFRCVPLYILITFTIGLLFVLSPLISLNPAQAAIVDVSGIEVPPANGPSPADGNDGGGQYDGGDDSNDTNSTTTPQPQPTPTQQPTPQPVDQEAQKRDLFEKEKMALLDNFAVSDEPEDTDSQDATTGTEAIPINEDTAFGLGPIPAGLSQPGGLTAEDWKNAGYFQKQIDELYSKWPLSKDEISLLEQCEFQRNELWRKAVNIPGLTAEERERIRLEFHVRGQRSDTASVPAIAHDSIEKWEKLPPPPKIKEPQSSAPEPVSVNPVTSTALKEFLVNRPTAGIEYYGQEVADTALDENPFGHVLNIAKIAVAYKKEGNAAARAATADFLVGLFPIPQATFAVDGGRVYANVAFQSLNKFMTDALKATGADFDKEKFWSELKQESSSGMQGLMEWIGNGAD